jgi:hypothetical protein
LITRNRTPMIIKECFGFKIMVLKTNQRPRLGISPSFSIFWKKIQMIGIWRLSHCWFCNKNYPFFKVFLE